MKQLMALLLAVTALVGCGQSYEETQRIRREHRRQALREDSAALKIAVLPTLDCLPLFLAKEHGMFDTLGVDVRLKPFAAQMDCDTAVAGGSVEGVVTDLVRAARMERKGVKLRYVAATGQYWQLLTNRNARIRQLKQLDDKMLAMTRYSVTDLLADRAVDSAKLKTERVFRIQVNDVALRLGMMLNGEMDAVILPEPYATKGRLAQCPVLLDSRDMDLHMGVVAFREKPLKDKDRQRQLDAFLKAYNQACDSLNTRGLAYYRGLAATTCGVPAAVIDSMPRQRFERATPPREKDIAAAAKWLK